MKKTIIFSFILLANLFLISAMSYPHGFHGIINVDDGSDPNGLTLLGKINGVTIGSCIISDGKYDLVIIDNVGTGGEIEFYIGEEKAKETSEFITFEVTELDLTFDTIPSEVGDCGNGICDNEECSSCPIDCGISECLGNGICDLEMGEDYLTAPNDCSSCGDGICNNYETCSSCPADCGCSSGYTCTNGICVAVDDGGNSGGGGGGSSGGSTSDGLSDEIPLIQTQEDLPETDFLSVEELNEADEQRETSSSITGGVIGFVKTGKGIGLIFSFLIIVFGIGVITLKKRASKNE